MATVTVNAPKTPVTKGSSGIAAATVPNVCKMPGPPAPFVPTPLPNIGRSGDSPEGYSTSVKIEGQPVAIRGASFGSKGDIASQGTGGGIVSSNVQGPTKFLGPGSMNVKIEGKNVQLLGDPMLNNCGPSGSPANAATMAGLLQSPLMQAVMFPEEVAGTRCRGGSTHTWEAVEAPGKTKIGAKIAERRAELKTGAQFEAVAAEHNCKSGHLKRSSQLSGGGEEVRWRCKVCPMYREGDQLHDGPHSSSPPMAVEVKNKPEMTVKDARQLGRNLQAMRQGAASGVVYKLPAGPAANKFTWQVHALAKKIGAKVTVIRI